MLELKNDIENDQRILSAPPFIAPVANGIIRPLWSVMIPVYNCSEFLKITLEGVLRQDPGEPFMQIEVVDDCSTDVNVEQLVNEIGKGRIKYYRQTHNLGSLRNFRTCLERSKGQLIHLLHGDDCVKPDFYQRLQRLFKNEPSIGAGFCRYNYVDEKGDLLHPQSLEMGKEGILDNWVERLCERQRIQYVSIVVKREVYEKLGGFYGAEYGEDWEMWVRIAAKYPIGYIPDVLAEYRRHSSSISGKSFLTGKNMKELEWAMQRIHEYLPAERRSDIIGKCRTFYAHYALTVANSLWKDLRHKTGAKAQVSAAWDMQRDISLCFKILKLFTRMTLNI